MAQKRKDGAGDELTGREKKKLKMTAARTIAVQPAKTLTFSDNAVAGPSSKSAVNSLNGLPSAIDVEKFAEARAFEIDAMHNAMKNASASSTSRAWQALPRHLRRRAASHDVRRVPVRLREKARSEMDPLRKKPRHSMSKLGKSRRLTRTELFVKRQRDKLWLETHIWHAKRMKMENMWGYRLAVCPTEKSYRPSHRASVHGSIIHDASYHSVIELKGTEDILKKILDMSCDPNGPSPGSKRYSSGSRALETFIYKSGAYPFGLICPATVIWRASGSGSIPATDAPHSEDEQNAEPGDNQAASKRKRKGKGKEKDQTVSQPSPESIRVVWLISHPSAYEDVLLSIQTSASLILESDKRQNPEKEVEIEIADLRGQVNIFEIMGPKSNQVLRGALSPIPQDKREDFKNFWTRFTNIQTSGELSRGTVVGCTVVDPRLKFPPKNAKPQTPPTEYTPSIAVFPSAQLAQSQIWDESVRAKLSTPRYKKKDLDERRSKLLIPGTPLKADRQDDRIPVLLVQRSLEAPESPVQGIHGWTVIIPSGWSMAFFSSLTFTGTRVGGQRERQTQAFDAGAPYFPRDLPSSTGYETYISAQAKEEKARWDRKPPAKRPNYEKLGTKNPWRPDWHGLLGIPRPTVEEEDNAAPTESGLVSTQREERMEEVVDDPGMWLLRGSDVPSVVSNISKMFNAGAALLQEINKLRMKRSHDPLPSTMKADDLMKRALVTVRIKMCKRGAPEDLAIIYKVSPDEAKRWEQALRNIQGFDEETEEEKELSQMIPPESSVIGYITTGHFSLSQGQGFAIGAIPLVEFLALQDLNEK
ncbi:hypothetical protein H0H92_006499 [Tricholoma furcatifolium]|nr:hypothetical protein H0H92_006499 [Tricholoma furcatifolium]